MNRFFRVFIVLFFTLFTAKLAAHAMPFVSDEDTFFFNNDSIAAAHDVKFLKKYNSLVARAYFKLIVEAERADIRLSKAYVNLYEKSEQNMHNIGVQNKFTGVYHRFLTHRRMLSGLKSWRIFSEDRTGDIEYFKAEYRPAVYSMYRKKTSDERILAFLMYKLADLYHQAD